MKKLLITSSIFAMLVLLSESALAGTVKVRVGPSKQNFITDMQLNTQAVSYTNDYTSVSVGLTYITESGYYIDWLVLPRSTSNQNDGGSREDLSSVIGKTWTTDAGLIPSLYVGYTNGSTRLGPLNYRTSIDEVGYVLGGGLGIPLDMGGAIGLSIGLGSISINLRELPTNSNANLSGSSSGNIGYSYGLSYTYPINETFGVTAEYRAQNYNYTLSGSVNGTVSEKMNRLGLNLYAQF